MLEKLYELLEGYQNTLDLINTKEYKNFNQNKRRRYKCLLFNYEFKIGRISKEESFNEKELLKYSVLYPNAVCKMYNLPCKVLDYLCHQICDDYYNSFMFKHFQNENEGKEFFFIEQTDSIKNASEYYIGELLKTNLIYEKNIFKEIQKHDLKKIIKEETKEKILSKNKELIYLFENKETI